MGNKWKIIITAVILAASAIFVTVLLLGSSQNPEYILDDGSLTISCQFGITVPGQRYQ